MSTDPYGDLTVCKPAPKPEPTTNGTGQKKRPQSADQIAKYAEKTARETKCQECRICPNEKGWVIQPHHIVRRSKGLVDLWHVNGVMGLCLPCHTKYHEGDAKTRELIRKALTAAELEYTVDAGHHDYADKNYFRLPKDDRGQPAVWDATRTKSAPPESFGASA